MRVKGHAVHAEPLSAECEHGCFLAPTLIEIDLAQAISPAKCSDLVLHVLRYKREALIALIDGINACGYALHRRRAPAGQSR